MNKKILATAILIGAVLLRLKQFDGILIPELVGLAFAIATIFMV